MSWINDDEEIIKGEPEPGNGLFWAIIFVVLILMMMWGVSSG